MYEDMLKQNINNCVNDYILVGNLVESLARQNF